MTTDTVIRWAGEHPELAEAVQSIEPTWAGILPSELLAILAIIRGMGIIHVVESGRYDGTSTEALLAAGLWVDSIERVPDPEKDKRFTSHRLRMHKGDGCDLAPPLTGRVSALLLDGPKARTARALAEQCDARVTFLHDFHRANPARKGLAAWFTDDEDWVAFSGHLDAGYWKVAARDGTAWKGGPYSATGGGSYGPTLAVLTHRRSA